MVSSILHMVTNGFFFCPEMLPCNHGKHPYLTRHRKAIEFSEFYVAALSACMSVLAINTVLKKTRSI